MVESVLIGKPLLWLLAVAGGVMGLGLLGLLLPLRPARLIAGVGLLQTGLLLLLGGLAAVSADEVAASLHGLVLAALVIGVLMAALLSAVLIALKQRAGSLQAERLEALAHAEWQAALGDVPAAAPGRARLVAESAAGKGR
jgi:multisubunit Na+/H+ antiporter MnhC subunit